MRQKSAVNSPAQTKPDRTPAQIAAAEARKLKRKAAVKEVKDATLDAGEEILLTKVAPKLGMWGMLIGGAVSLLRRKKKDT